MAVNALARRAWLLVFVLAGALICAAEGPFTAPAATAVGDASPEVDESANHATTTAGGPVLDSATPPSHAGGAEPSSDAAQADIPVAPAHEQRSERFQWKPALAQYGLEISIQHAWRFVHEPGTRYATAHGNWLKDWVDSVGETRGYDDADGWHASFVGHTLNGGIYGFIEQQNDPLYRNVEWGDGRIYWMSRLRAWAFSAVASTQWTLGPMSEASLGNVQLYASPGFVDLINTPCLGTFEMMGEDLLDRYVIIPLENHTANPWLILTARTLGNPARSFANLMAFKHGWTRATRPGIFGQNQQMRRELVREYKQGLISAPFGPHTAAERAAMNKAVEKPHSAEAPAELQAYAIYESFLGGGSCIGGGGQGAARISPSWQIVSEVNGCLVINMQKYHSGDSLTFSAGPRWTPRATRRFSPFAQVLFGGRRMTYEIDDPVKEDYLKDAWNNGTSDYFPKRSDYSIEYQALGFALTAGGGVDVAFGRAFAWRVVDVSYSHSWLPAVGPINATQSLQVRSGIVLRLGTW